MKCLNGDLGASHIRQKRGIFELSGAIHCGTGRSSLSYLGYGCYCGIGGHGIPKDRTDWCCHKHDCCYGYAEHYGCHPKSNGYNWKCDKNSIKCDYTRDLCQNILCKCDKELAKCLRKAPYKVKYALYPNFLCGKENPRCKYYKD
ncbi:group 10 secretory phospholipase A2 isoform X2 [Dendropsophus ebraccatus]|uniref:group 10 secretory phospholipase A2 isoform X2 n=1 Tax=Dendropsophus ebraccatus TaxID=150705 RepID=UPI003831E16A